MKLVCVCGCVSGWDGWTRSDKWIYAGRTQCSLWLLRAEWDEFRTRKRCQRYAFVSVCTCSATTTIRNVIYWRQTAFCSYPLSPFTWHFFSLSFFRSTHSVSSFIRIRFNWFVATLMKRDTTTYTGSGILHVFTHSFHANENENTLSSTMSPVLIYRLRLLLSVRWGWGRPTQATNKKVPINSR